MLVADRASFDFGTQVVGMPSATKTITITNTGGVASGSVSAGLSGSSDYFLVSDGCTGIVLPPSATCTVGVRFSPSAPARRARS
jgi:hypothetical protein